MRFVMVGSEVAPVLSGFYSETMTKENILKAGFLKTPPPIHNLTLPAPRSIASLVHLRSTVFVVATLFTVVCAFLLILTGGSMNRR